QELYTVHFGHIEVKQNDIRFIAVGLLHFTEIFERFFTILYYLHLIEDIHPVEGTARVHNIQRIIFYKENINNINFVHNNYLFRPGKRKNTTLSRRRGYSDCLFSVVKNFLHNSETDTRALEAVALLKRLKNGKDLIMIRC